MKPLLTATLAGAALCGYCLAQDANAPQTTAPTQSQQSPATPQATPATPGLATAVPRIAPGSVIPVQLSKSVDAKKAKTGDEVEARVTQDMKAMNGQTLLTKDTKVIGHITEDQPRTKDQKESHIAIAFDHVIAKNGGDSALPMSIQAIIAPSALGGGNNNSANSNSAASMPAPGGMPTSNPGGGRSPGMGAGASTPTPAPSAGSDSRTSSQTGADAH